jgi:hypothetical protein
MSPRFSLIRTFATLALAAAPLAAQAHGSDIEVEIVANQLTVEGFSATAFGTGHKIFEGDFGDFALGPHKTDDPGFDSHDGTFAAGQQLWYRGSGVLKFWNGATWGAAPAGKTFKIEDAIGGETLFTLSGVANPLGAVGQANVNGVVHAHLDLSINNAGPNPTPAGAYLITLSLTSFESNSITPTGYLDSDPFHLVMNHGLSAANFENAVAALAVPEPEAYAMLLAGALLVGAAARRQRERDPRDALPA